MTLGILREQSQRRTVMFVVLVVALSLLFLGSTFLAPLLFGRPLLFVMYWTICLWLTALAFLLAVYDLLAVRKAGRAERMRLRRKHLENQE